MHENWLERWRVGRTGWHEAGGNRGLKRHWAPGGRRVLVPLCGKTPDLLWLADRGNAVTGVELSEIAVQAFFEENALEYTIEDGVLKTYRAKRRDITIHCGDYFEFRGESRSESSGGPFDACYDRGALIALDAGLRPDYVAHTKSLLTEDALQLLITVEYDQSVCDGPPFSIAPEEVGVYWPNLRRVDAYDDLVNAPPKFLAAGLIRMTEVVWLMPGTESE